MADESLAFRFKPATDAYATDYPAAVGLHMTNIDSTPSMNVTPSIRLRENECGYRRLRAALVPMRESLMQVDARLAPTVRWRRRMQGLTVVLFGRRTRRAEGRARLYV